MSISELKARDLMNIDITFVRSDEKVAAVDLLMVRKTLGGVPVLDKNDKLVGIITQRDIMLSRFRTSIAGMTVDNLMTKNPITVSPDASLKEILTLMLKHNIERLPVLENGKLIGMVEPNSILYAVYNVLAATK
ncbi:MAG: CBS domain-containing protein [Candidatus Helarchaeota archaeon]